MSARIALAWWLALLIGVGMAARVLDAYHHMDWGRAGIWLLKAGYLGFAVVLFSRFLSFRSQKPFENLAEAYRKTVGGETVSNPVPATSPRRPYFHAALTGLAAADLLLLFHRSLATVRISMLADLAIWLLIIHWLGRAHWLKARGERERLKEALDDARSRARQPEVSPGRPAVGKSTFALLSAATGAAAVGLSGWRLANSGPVVRVDDLKACMERGLRDASEEFYRRGAIGRSLSETECLRSRMGVLAFELQFREGRLLLQAGETPGADFFGDGKPGNQGLVLDTEGRFRWIPWGSHGRTGGP